MSIKIPFEPFDDPAYVASNITSLKFDGVVSCEPGIHSNFLPKLESLSLIDSSEMEIPNCLKTLELGRTPFNTSPSWTKFVEGPNVENLSISLPRHDSTRGRFPSLKALQIHDDICEIMALKLDVEAMCSGIVKGQPNRLESLTMYDTGSDVLTRLGNKEYSSMLASSVLS
jgi:hypothetical protein